jgi:hypothetical protein
MKQLRMWFCRHREHLMRGSLLLLLMTPLVAWAIERTFAVDAWTVAAVIGSALFAVWRPYRDSWLRQSCNPRTNVCASH